MVGSKACFAAMRPADLAPEPDGHPRAAGSIAAWSAGAEQQLARKINASGSLVPPIDVTERRRWLLAKRLPRPASPQATTRFALRPPPSSRRSMVCQRRVVSPMVDA